MWCLDFFVLTFIFFSSCMKQWTRSEIKVQRRLRRLWRRTRRWKCWICSVSITHTLPHSLMTLDLISHHVCVRRSRQAFFFKIRWSSIRWLELCCILLCPWFGKCLRYCCCVFVLIRCFDFLYSHSFFFLVWNRQRDRRRRCKGNCGGFEDEQDVDEFSFVR